MNSKQCNKCGQSKELHQFAKNKNCADGHLTTCKECAKLYRQQNATQRKITDELRRRKHGVAPKTVFANDEDRKAAHTQACVRWQHRNQDWYKTQQKIYRDAHREYRYSLIKQWRQDNKGRINAMSSKRKVSISRATPKWADHEAIAVMYDQSQELTTQTGIQHNVDHFYPIHGKTVCGLHVAENLQVITKQENLDKSNMHPDDFYRDA